MAITRAFKIWFFTNLLGAVLLLFVSGEGGTINSDFFFIVILGGIFSLPALVFSAINIYILKRLPEEPPLRVGYIVASASVIISSVLFVVGIAVGESHSLIGFAFEVLEFLYPYCITALITTFYFTRDLILIRKEEETIRLKDITGYEQE